MGFKRLFFDIETSYCQGWFWKPQYKTSISYEQVIKDAAIICICYKWQGSDKIYSLKWDKGDDKSMIEKFIKVLVEADEIVGHNSDKFDLRWVRTRCLIHGCTSLPEFKSIDTLKVSRSKFHFPSNRLDAIGKYLGFGGKIDTGGIELWHDIIQRNSTKAMSEMITYCKRDVELLEKVYLKLEGFTPQKTHIGKLTGGNGCSCPRCGSNTTHVNARRVSSTGIKTVKMVCRDCKRYFTVNLSTYNACRSIEYPIK